LPSTGMARSPGRWRHPPVHRKGAARKWPDVPPPMAPALPAAKLASRLIKTPKLHVGDTGIACALLNRDAAALWEDRALLGQMLETFVCQELRRQASWQEDEIRFHHFRDRDGFEVDLVLERPGGDLAGVEVKAGATVTAADFRGLQKPKDGTGKHFRAGVVLFDGEMAARFGEGLYAVPRSEL
jgi:uncharacterized protein